MYSDFDYIFLRRHQIESGDIGFIYLLFDIFYSKLRPRNLTDVVRVIARGMMMYNVFYYNVDYSRVQSD